MPSGELRDLAHLPREVTPGGVAEFDKCVNQLAQREGRGEAERLRHALSMVWRDGTLRPKGLLDPAFLNGRGAWEQHLYLHGLLAVAKQMQQAPPRGRDKGGPRVLVVGEFREQLGSFRGTIAREINRRVFRPGTLDGNEPPDEYGRPMALTADIGVRIRLENSSNKNHVLCSTCSRNNDRLDGERFHPPAEMNEVCIR